MEDQRVVAKYLLDTDMVIDLIRSSSSVVAQKVREVTMAMCAIADITLYELYCGAVASKESSVNIAIVDFIKSKFTVLNSSEAYLEAARQKKRLKELGMAIEDKDLLIGCTAKVNGLVAVTGNAKHLGRIEGLDVCSWR
ncbi:MAG: PIN domain-containing protein [Bacteroidales bacterium]|nr:PIN domain-containing protein [Bacteroidales bacterium]